ncbi:hypothetical protein EVAR_27130_1 [Eumeta japonica]|uniref:Uncharacterized protein n=1 Tax=Eumeta variegata TaxID=151549 RepID=A0A4C1W080_EUMVA|nr:hypothetical protein EVAR_27130_1 [Eumeta japonica]
MEPTSDKSTRADCARAAVTVYGDQGKITCMRRRGPSFRADITTQVEGIEPSCEYKHQRRTRVRGSGRPESANKRTDKQRSEQTRGLIRRRWQYVPTLIEDDSIIEFLTRVKLNAHEPPSRLRQSRPWRDPRPAQRRRGMLNARHLKDKDCRGCTSVMERCKSNGKSKNYTVIMFYHNIGMQFQDCIAMNVDYQNMQSKRHQNNPNQKYLYFVGEGIALEMRR